MERRPVSNMTRRVVLVVANVLLREGLARILSAADFSIVASTSCADTHVLSTLSQEQPVLLIIDVSDDFEAGLRQIASFKRCHPGGRVAVLADQRQLTEMVPAFRAGANAYLMKVATCETFIKSLELVMLGVTFLPPEILMLIYDQRARSSNGRAGDDGHASDDDKGGEDFGMAGTDVETNERALPAESTHEPRLSARQQSILRCLVLGDSNKTIARKMAMAEATVKVHVKAILRKIRVHNRTQAAIWATRNGAWFPAKDDAPPVLEDLPGDRFSHLDVLQIQAGCNNGSNSLPMLELKGAGRIAMPPGSLRLVRKGG